MPREGSLRVFVSSTSEDLIRHRQIVREVVVECGHTPVMMQDFGAKAAHTVAACRGYVASADLVLAMCAFRRGWVPTRAQGGDGTRSITGLEIETARWLGIPVYWFLAHESWPGSLYEPSDEGREWVRRFRAELNQPAAFFAPGEPAPGRAEPEPKGEFRLTVKATLLDHLTNALVKHTVKPPRVRTDVERALEDVLPLLDDGLRVAPHVTVEALATEHRRAAPARNHPRAPTEPVEAAYVYASDLAGAPRRSDGGVPLLEFVRAAAHLLPAHTAPLTAWADAIAGRLGEAHVEALMVNAVRPDPAPRRPEVTAALKALQPALEVAVRCAPALTEGALWAAYTGAAPLGWAPRAEYQPDPVRAVEEYSYNLAPAGPVNKAHPLLTFARALLALVPAEHRTPVASVVRDAGQLLGETEPAPAPPAALAVPAAPRPNSLLIAVWPHPIEPDKYTVKGWLDRPLSEDEKAYTRAELPTAIALLYQKMPKSPKRTELWVEVFMPGDLVAEKVDRWEVPVGKLKRVVGCENPVLIRAADLYYDGELEESRAILGERWRGVADAGAVRVVEVDQLPPPQAKPEFVFRPPHPSSGRELYNRLFRNRAVLGVVLGAPPTEDALNHLLHVGMPVVAWSRGCSVSALAELLDQQPLTDLPDRVRALRLQADLDDDPEHAGNHIAVLYDDPTRPPPDVAHPLETPEPLHG